VFGVILFTRLSWGYLIAVTLSMYCPAKFSLNTEAGLIYETAVQSKHCQVA